MKSWRKVIMLSWLLILLAASSSFAHKVNLFAYAEGGTVYSESYFPDGRPIENGKVLVYDSQEQLLLEGKTDKDGLFQFQIPKQGDLTLMIEASMGHKNKFMLKKSALQNE